MKLAAPFTNDTRWRDLPDEYMLKYSERSKPEKLLDFCELFPDKRVVVSFKNCPIDYATLIKANAAEYNVTVMLDSTAGQEALTQLKENNIKFFYGEYCSTFSMLDTFCSLGVSDIYVYDQLLYNLPQVKEKCDKFDINVRLVLNVVPMVVAETPQDKSIIFSPKDKDLLDKYIDIAEFYCKKPYDWHMFNVLRKAWFEDKEWRGSLEEITFGMKEFLPALSIYPGFNERKIQCGRRCSIGANCHHCDNWMEFARDRNAKGIAFRAK